MKSSQNFTSNFLKSLQTNLIKMKKDIEGKVSRLKKNDPFIKEYKQDGFRNVDALEEEVADLDEHKETNAILFDLRKTIKDINDTLVRIRNGKYGVCEECSSKINSKRLLAYPTAKYCILCEKKFEKKV